MNVRIAAVLVAALAFGAAAARADEPRNPDSNSPKVDRKIEDIGDKTERKGEKAKAKTKRGAKKAARKTGDAAEKAGDKIEEGGDKAKRKATY
jgi:hypothetical protein